MCCNTRDFADCGMCLTLDTTPWTIANCSSWMAPPALSAALTLEAFTPPPGEILISAFKARQQPPSPNHLLTSGINRPLPALTLQGITSAVSTRWSTYEVQVR